MIRIEVASSPVALWGARKGQIQIGSPEDRARERWLRRLAAMQRRTRLYVDLGTQTAAAAAEIVTGLRKAFVECGFIPPYESEPPQGLTQTLPLRRGD